MFSYLLPTSHGVWYFRIAVPSELRGIIGCREIKKSLKTTDRKKAQRLAIIYGAQISEFFERLRMSNGKRIIPFSEFKVRGIDLANGTVEEIETDGTLEDAHAANEFISSLQTTLQRRRTSGPTREELEAMLDERLKTLQTSAAPSIQSSWTLRELFDRFIKHKQTATKNGKSKKKKGWSVSTATDRASLLNTIYRILDDDVQIHRFTEDDADAYLEILCELPTNLTKQKDFAGLSIEQVIKKNTGATLKDLTIRKYLGLVSEAFDYAVQKKQLTENVFSTINEEFLVQDKAETTIFEPSEIDQLSNSDFSTDYLSRQDRAYLRWVILIGLYTGARLGEIIALGIDDVREEDGIWFFDIKQEAKIGRFVKTRAGIRKTPVHQDLIEQHGLLDYVENRRKTCSSKSRLIDAPVYTHKKTQLPSWSHYASKHFSTLRDKTGLDGRGLKFHSLRGTLSTALMREEVSREMIKAIIGHSDKSDTLGAHYLGKFRLKDLKEAIDKFSLSSL